jgi:hypothetical protein
MYVGIASLIYLPDITVGNSVVFITEIMFGSVEFTRSWYPIMMPF